MWQRIIFIAAFVCSSGAQGDDLHIRQDLQPFFASQLCDKKNITTKLFWEAGIFDAQIEGKVIPPKEMTGINAAAFIKIAESKTRGLGHLGWIGGKCSDGAGWIVSTPAAKNFIQFTDESIYVAHNDMLPFCKEITVRFADAEKAPPLTVSLEDARLKNGVMAVETAKKSRGMLSVSCLPKEGSAIANLWFLVPVKGGPLPDPPFASQLKETDSIEQWVNKLRTNEGLPELKILADSHLKKITTVLLTDDSVKHNKDLLDKAETELKKSHYTTVGENRVKALSPKTMGWLLWNSPSHRDLILSKKPKALVVSSKKLGNETLASLLFVAPIP